MTIIYHHDLIQNTDEWLDTRLGLITASQMKVFITPSFKLANNSKSRNLTFELAAQRFTGFGEPFFETWDMTRGHIEEEYAKDLYGREYSVIEYFMFCDQDDVWSAQKLARQAAAMAALERVHGRHCPLLVHSDLSLVGQELEPQHPSLMRCHLIRRPDQPPALTLLMQNHVVGCTVLMNRALLTLATPLPTGVYMHDWWVALCARFAGVTQYLPEPLVAYRQHHQNQVGAHGLGERIVRPTRWLGWVRKMNSIYFAAFAQARDLEQRLQSIERPAGCCADADDAARRLRAFIELGRKPRLLRPWSLLGIGGRSQNALMTGLFYVQSSTLAEAK